MIDWGWIVGHLDDIAAVGLGARAPHGDRGGRRRGAVVRRWRSSSVGSRRPSARSPSSAACSTRSRASPCSRCSCPITGFTLLTAEIGLVSYTLLILVRNMLAGLDGVPGDVTEAARAWA